MKMKCKHPNNYEKECSQENCPATNPRDVSFFEILVATADGDCEYGYWEEEKEKKE